MFGVKRKRRVLWLSVPQHWRLILAALVGLILVAAVLDTYPTEPSWSALPLSGQVIALDAGHGGRDGGAVSASGIVEKEIALAISLYLRDYLQEAGAAVIMTREDDRELSNPEIKGGMKRQDLTKRVEIVNSSDADLMLSIHLNAIGSSRWSGAQTFYQSSRDQASKTLAVLIQEEFIRHLENTDRVAKVLDRNVFLMRSADMPAALVEVGFLSNPGEASLLATEAYQRKVAAAIYEGVLRYASGEKLGS